MRYHKLLAFFYPCQQERLGPKISCTYSLTIGIKAQIKSINETFSAGISDSSSGNGFSDFVSATSPNVAQSPAQPKKSEEEEFFAPSIPSQTTSGQANDGKMSKDSILALFGQKANNSPSPMMQNPGVGGHFGGFGAAPQAQQPMFHQGGENALLFFIKSKSCYS